MNQNPHTNIRHAVWLPLVLLGLLNACVLIKPEIRIQEDQVAGVYSAITDFSREVQNMNGARETMIYKKGREEKLKFMNNHSFIKTIHYSSDRVADQIVMGNWELSEDHLIHAYGHEAAGSFSEFYKLEGPARNLIRLDANKKKLASEYAPFFTYYRQGAGKLSADLK